MPEREFTLTRAARPRERLVAARGCEWRRLDHPAKPTRAKVGRLRVASHYLAAR